MASPRSDESSSNAFAECRKSGGKKFTKSNGLSIQGNHQLRGIDDSPAVYHWAFRKDPPKFICFATLEPQIPKYHFDQWAHFRPMNDLLQNLKSNFHNHFVGAPESGQQKFRLETLEKPRPLRLRESSDEGDRLQRQFRISKVGKPVNEINQLSKSAGQKPLREHRHKLRDVRAEQSHVIREWHPHEHLRQPIQYRTRIRNQIAFEAQLNERAECCLDIVVARIPKAVEQLAGARENHAEPTAHLREISLVVLPDQLLKELKK
jgi:hypothetical protein